jgi:superfamily II DNA/RNA helicase
VPQVGALCGSQQGQQRASTLAKFNRGQLHVLLTSDAFGLGLDYQGVDVVVCLDEAAPTTQAYVARWVTPWGRGGGHTMVGKGGVTP